MSSLFLSLLGDVPAGEQHEPDAGLSPAELLAGLLEIGDGLTHGVGLLAAALGVEFGTRIRDLTMARQFPQPLRFGRAIRYSAAEVQDWIRDRKSQRASLAQ